MPKISNAMLSNLRAQALDYLPDSGTILTVTRTSDGMGGWTSSWAGSVAVACRVDVVNGRELQTGGGYITYQKTMLTLPSDTTIATTNRFSYYGGEYDVVAVSDSSRSWNVFTRCELEKV